MSSDYSTIQQHQPLRVPDGWSQSEKWLVVQLEELFDDIYRRFGRLRAEDMKDGAITTEKIAKEAIVADKLAASAINAVFAHIAEADIDWASIRDLETVIATITSATINAADINWAKIKDLVTGRAIITQGEAGQLYIAQLAVTEANLVSLTVGELMVKGQDGGFYAVSVDETGQIVTERKEVVNDDVRDGSIHGGQKLIEGSVTAEVLNAQQIFGDSAIIRELIAANLDVDTLFAREATINKINTLDITGNESIRLYVQKQDAINVYLRVTENGLEIGKEGDPARFRADNRTLEVTNVKTERLGIAQSMAQDEEWAWIATRTGLGLKYIGEAVT